MIIFLGFDGVLHHNEVSLSGDRPVMQAEGHKLFENAHVLSALVSGRRDIKIVLTTSWVPVFGFDIAKSLLPPALQELVIEATWDGSGECTKAKWCQSLTRWQQIQTYVNRHCTQDWIAIDDDDKGWPDDKRHLLIHCEEATKGIALESVARRLRFVLGGASRTLVVDQYHANLQGRDFIVGDLHGELATFESGLEQVGFDCDLDRMFSVGDLIDRGPNSVECLRLLKKPWFHAVRGNHEELMLKAQRSFGQFSVWQANGGEWWQEIGSEMRDELLGLTKTMPLVIVVGEGESRYNILHAEYGGTDTGLCNEHFNQNGWENILWGRSNIMEHHRSKVDPAFWPKHRLGLSPTFVGHTTLRGNDCIEVDSHIYLDTGTHTVRAGEKGWLTITELVPATNRVKRFHKIEVVI